MTSPMPTLQRHVQLKSIAVLTDLGENAEKPLRFAASLARWYGAQLTVAHACAPDFYIYIPPEPLPAWPGNGLSAKQRAEQRTRSLLGKAGLAHAAVSTVVSSSSLAELLEALELRQPDLLVLATHARTGINKWLSGSVMAEVFRRVKWPVLVLPPGALKHDATLSQFQKVLFGTDLSEVSARAFAYAAGIAEDHGAHMVALYADSDGTAYSFERLIALQRLEDWLHRQSVVHGSTQWPECIVRFGKPADELKQAASECKAELIVVGAQSLGAISGVASHFVGGTAYGVACSSACPVLIVPDAG